MPGALLEMEEICGTHEGDSRHIAVVVSRFNETVTKGLLAGALDALRACGVAEDAITVVRVPGALELPVAALHLARSGRHDAVVALGAVIEGETDHYLHVSTETTRGCGQVALQTGVPVLFGVLTCKNLPMARARSTVPSHNKGAEAARAAVEMANLLAALRDRSEA